MVGLAGRDPGGEGNSCAPGAGDAPVGLLAQVEPYDGLHLRMPTKVVEHAGDPGGLVPTVIGAADFADLYGLVGCKSVQGAERGAT